MTIGTETHLRQRAIDAERAVAHLEAQLTAARQARATLGALLRESKRADHQVGCMAGWAQVGVVYKDTPCSCEVGEWNARVDAALAADADVSGHAVKENHDAPR